jgi:hypothetical protein
MPIFPADLGKVETIKDLAHLPEMHLRYKSDVQDNSARASFAALAVVAFVRRVGDAGDLGTSISDLLGDLRHLCDALGLDYDSLDLHGLAHYNAELRGEM